jgi:hypothetical protein
LPVPEKQVERLTKRIGDERVAERVAAVEKFQKLTLVERCDSKPAGVVGPGDGQVAVVMADAGMLQLRATESAAADILPFPLATACEERAPSAAGIASVPQELSSADPGTEAEDNDGDDADERRPAGRHWHEDKVGLVLTMSSTVQLLDPCPQVPETFVDPAKIANLVRGLKGKAALGEDGLEEPVDPDASAEAAQTRTYEPPKLEQRQVVASRQRWPLFGPTLAATAWLHGFAPAARKAFVGDGASAIWRLHQRFFSSYVPILDFIHALSYVFAAARAAGGNLVNGWPLYVTWIEWVWQGQVARVIEALASWQAEYGEPAKDDTTSAAAVVQRSLRYLRNHQDKMKYDDYRRAGLPITSSLMESMVKQIGRRVKGTEKFWAEDGAEALLQLRADYLSDGEGMEEFWERRQAQATGRRRYRKTG